MKLMLSFSIVFVIAAMCLPGCESKAETSGGNSAVASDQPGISASVFVETAPANAMAVSELKASDKRDGEVVVRGRIGGRARPFVDGAAVFVLIDSKLKSCNELHGDDCRTPWDYCCETPESIAANTATIQIVDADGKPIRQGAEGEFGLKPLARVVIAGEIASRSADGNLLINARRIRVQPQ